MSKNATLKEQCPKHETLALVGALAKRTLVATCAPTANRTRFI